MVARAAQVFLKSSWWLLIVALVLVAAYLVIGRAITYSVAGNQQLVEDFLSERGFGYVSIGEISGGWAAYDPSFVVRNVSVAPEGDVVFAVDSLRLKLDSISSLLNRTAIVTEIEVSGVRFELERSESGLAIRGLPSGTGEFDPDRWLDSLPYLERIELSGVDVDVYGRTLSINIQSRDQDPWIINKHAIEQVVSLPVYFERYGQDGLTHEGRLHLKGAYSGDPREQDFSARFHIDLPEVDLMDFIPEVHIRNGTLSEMGVRSQIWIDIEGNQLDVTGDVTMNQPLFEIDNQVQGLFDELNGRFRFQGDTFRSGKLWVPELKLQVDGELHTIAGFEVALETVQGELQLAGAIPELDVKQVSRLIDLAADKKLIDPAPRDALLSVTPRGRLQDIRFLRSDDTVRLTSRIRDFSMDAYKGVPAVDKLQGFLSLTPEKGYLDIDSSDFELNFSNMFPKPWPFDSGRGRVSYLVADGKVNVSSGLIELLRGDLVAYGKLALNFPGSQALQTWGLSIGIQNAELLDANRYIPNTIPVELANWLEWAIQEGMSAETGLTIHGSLFRGSPAVRKTHDLYFKVKDTAMRYHEDWPALSNLSGTVHINNYAVSSDDITGQVLDTAVEQANVNVPIRVDGSADTVLVHATASGDMADLVRVLNETPIREDIGGVAHNWVAEGEVDATLVLDVPLGRRSDEPFGSDVSVRFADAWLKMPDYDLQISQLTGSANYHFERGLTSERFTGTMFEKPVTGSIQTELFGQGGELIVKVDGSIMARDLYRWSDQLLLSKASGELNYQSSVHVPFGGSLDYPYVEATSDLIGVTFDLPYPLLREDESVAEQFHYRQLFLDHGYRVQISKSDSIRADLEIKDSIATGGRIHLGQAPVGAVSYDGLRMSGELDYLNYEAWIDALDELGELSDVSLEGEIANHMAPSTLLIDQLDIFSLDLIQAEVQVAREQGQWHAHISNEMLEGDVRVADADNVPIEIALTRLQFDGEDGDSEDPLEGVNPLEIIDVDFVTEQLLLDGHDYGRWSFNFRVEDDVAHFRNLEAKGNGLHILSTSDAKWFNEEHESITAFTGDILISDLSQALETFGLASSIEGKNLKIGAAINWQGSPAAMDVDFINGNVEIQEGEGRFVQADTGGALKLLGIFDFASIARRLRLDFSDVVEKGFEFKDIKGVTSFAEGQIDVKEPIVINGTSGKFTVGGSVNLNTRELDNDMIVTLPVSRTLPWYAAYSAIATGPLAGAGVMLAQRLFENQINQMSSAKYKIDGTIEEPNIQFVAIFEDDVRETASTEVE